MTRRDRIIILLDHYRDYFEISCGGTGAGKDYGPQLPRMANHTSVKELCRCLELLNRMAPAHYQHLKAYYTAEWRTAWAAKRKLVPFAQREGAHYDPKRRAYAYRCRATPAWVIPRMVELGVDFVASEFRGEPFIPDELTGRMRTRAVA